MMIPGSVQTDEFQGLPTIPISNIKQAGNGNVSALPNATWGDYYTYLGNTSNANGPTLGGALNFEMAKKLGNQLINPVIGPGGVPINGGTSTIGMSAVMPNSFDPSKPQFYLNAANLNTGTAVGHPYGNDAFGPTYAPGIPTAAPVTPLQGGVSSTGGTGGNAYSEATGGQSNSSAQANNTLIMPTNFTPPNMDIPDFAMTPQSFGQLPGYQAPNMAEVHAGRLGLFDQKPAATVSAAGGGGGGSESKREQGPAQWVEPGRDDTRGPATPLTGGVEKNDQKSSTPYMNMGAAPQIMAAMQAPERPNALQMAAANPNSVVASAGNMVPPMFDPTKLPAASETKPRKKAPYKAGMPVMAPVAQALQGGAESERPLFRMGETRVPDRYAGPVDRSSDWIVDPRSGKMISNDLLEPSALESRKDQNLAAGFGNRVFERKPMDAAQANSQQKRREYNEAIHEYPQPNVRERMPETAPDIGGQQRRQLGESVRDAVGLLKDSEQIYKPRPQMEATPEGRDQMYGENAMPKESPFVGSASDQANHYLNQATQRVNDIKRQYAPMVGMATEQIHQARALGMQAVARLNSLPTDDQMRQQAANEARELVGMQDQQANGLMSQLGAAWRGQYLKPSAQRFADAYSQAYNRQVAARTQTQDQAQSMLTYANSNLTAAMTEYNNVTGRQNQEITQELQFQRSQFANQNQYTQGAGQYNLGSVNNEIRKTDGYLNHINRQDQIESGYALGQGRNRVAAYQAGVAGQRAINDYVLGNRRLDIAKYSAENQAADIQSRIGQRGWEQLHGDRNDQIRAAVSYNQMLNNSARTDIARGNLKVSQGNLSVAQQRQQTSQQLADMQQSYNNWKMQFATGEEFERGFFNTMKLLQADHNASVNDRLLDLRERLTDNQISSQQYAQETARTVEQQRSRDRQLATEYQKFRDGKADGFKTWQLMLQTGKEISPWIKKGLDVAASNSLGSVTDGIMDAGIDLARSSRNPYLDMDNPYR